MTQVFFSLARRKTQASVRTARLFNAASGKKSKSKCINFALENYIFTIKVKAMDELIVKFGMLNAAKRQEILDFLDFLLSKQEKEDTEDLNSYKAKILKVSNWSEEDIKLMQANSKKMNAWQVPEW